jgi:hypothetical protein
VGATTESKAAAAPGSGPVAQRLDPERERKRTKHGLVRERPRAPGRAAAARSQPPPHREPVEPVEPVEDEEAAAEPAAAGGLGHDLEHFALHAAAVEPAAVVAPAPTPDPGLLEVSEPGDELEREADSAAERVLVRLAAAPAGLPVDNSAPPRAGGRVQRSSLVEVVGEATGLTPRTETPGGLIVEDQAETVAPGQMRKTKFLEELRARALEAAQAELEQVGRSAEGCPYIEKMIARFARRPAKALERAIRKYSPEAREAEKAEEYLDLVTKRLRRGVASWAKTGKMPEGLPDDLKPGRLSNFLEAAVSIGKAAVGAGKALFKGRGKRGVDAGALADRLGPGRPLDGGVRARMEGAFAQPFGDVRVHHDPGAAILARDLEARAFTVGSHVAFGADQFRPGTPAGDALLAHELAHVLQQRGAAPLAGLVDAAPSAEHERDADRAAAGAAVALWVPGARRRPRPAPRVRGAMRLARCSDSYSPADVQRYLEVLDRTGKIEGGSDSHSKARYIAAQWGQGAEILLPPRRKILLVQEMLDGTVSGDDQEGILEILERSPDDELQILFAAGGLDAATLEKSFSGDHAKRLAGFFTRRCKGGLDAVKAGKLELGWGREVPIGAPLPGPKDDEPAGTTRKTSVPDKAEVDRLIQKYHAGDLNLATFPDAKDFRLVQGVNLKPLSHKDFLQDLNGPAAGPRPPDDGTVAFYRAATNEIVYDENKWMAHTFIHEGLHRYTPPGTEEVLATDPVGAEALREAITDYFARKICRAEGYAVDIDSYPDREPVAEELAILLGEDMLRSALFGRKFAELKKAFEAKRGPGSFDVLLGALRPRNLDAALKAVAAPPAPPAPVKKKAVAPAEPADALERDADAAAARVVRRLAGSAPPADPVTARAAGPMVQRSSLFEVAAATGVPKALGLGKKDKNLIVDDGTKELTDGQMTKTEFLDQMRPVVTAAAEEELARAGRSARDCPYIEQLIARFAARPAASLERTVRRYAPEAAGVKRAADYLPYLEARVAKGVAIWAKTGQMPPGLPEEMSPRSVAGLVEAGIGAAVTRIGALFKVEPGAPTPDADPGALAARLGPGEPLDPWTRGRMEGAFGRHFSDVRVHVGGAAPGLARDLRAHAFTVGPHVAFGAGAYRPGTATGDALLAHELAHVVQQSGAPAAAPDGDAGLEREADEAAHDAVAGTWGPADVRRPRRAAVAPSRAGLRLSRCHTEAAKPEPKTPYQALVVEGMQRLLNPRIGFGVPWGDAEGCGNDSSTSPFDTDNWQSALTDDKQSCKLVTKVKPSKAIEDLFSAEKRERWQIDCGMFSQLPHYWALLQLDLASEKDKEKGAAKFDRRFDGKITLRKQYSSGLRTRELWVWSVDHEGRMVPEGSLVKLMLRRSRVGGPASEPIKVPESGRPGAAEKTVNVPKLALKDGKAEVRRQEEILAEAPVGTRVTWGVRSRDRATVDNTLKMGPDLYAAHNIEEGKSGFYTRQQIAEHIGPAHGKKPEDVFVTLIELFDLPLPGDQKDEAAPPDEPAGKEAPGCDVPGATPST